MPPPAARSPSRHPRPPPPGPTTPPGRRTPPPSLSPQTLALTDVEREFAVTLASVLRTPRTVKTLTNLYRLLRARLDEPSEELTEFPRRLGLRRTRLLRRAGPPRSDRWVSAGGVEVPARPGRSSAVAAPETRSWRDYVVELRRDNPELVAFLERVAPPTPRGQSWTREPFRRWALEVSRYSFETGQEVFTRRHNSALTATPNS